MHDSEHAEVNVVVHTVDLELWKRPTARHTDHHGQVADDEDGGDDGHHPHHSLISVVHLAPAFTFGFVRVSIGEVGRFCLGLRGWG